MIVRVKLDDEIVLEWESEEAYTSDEIKTRIQAVVEKYLAECVCKAHSISLNIVTS